MAQIHLNRLKNRSPSPLLVLKVHLLPPTELFLAERQHLSGRDLDPQGRRGGRRPHRDHAPSGAGALNSPISSPETMENPQKPL